MLLLVLLLLWLASAPLTRAIASAARMPLLRATAQPHLRLCHCLMQLFCSISSSSVQLRIVTACNCALQQRATAHCNSLHCSAASSAAASCNRSTPPTPMPIASCNCTCTYAYCLMQLLCGISVQQHPCICCCPVRLCNGTHACAVSACSYSAASSATASYTAQPHFC